MHGVSYVYDTTNIFNDFTLYKRLFFSNLLSKFLKNISFYFKILIFSVGGANLFKIDNTAFKQQLIFTKTTL